jgi:opacity protein-like surface antigen
MARVWVSGIAVLAFLLVFQAGNFAQAQQPAAEQAKEKPVKPHSAQPAAALAPTLPPPTYNWDGFYAGMNVGAAWGAYDPTTATTRDPQVGYLLHPADIAAVNAAGAQVIDPLGFAGGGQVGYNLQFGRSLLGIEGEADYLHLLGAANSGAIRYPAGGSGFFNGNFKLNQFVVSSYADADWLMMLRPRVGLTANNWLFYVTGGLALTKLQGQLLFTDGNARGAVLGAFQEGNIDTFRAGYAVGGGIETALTDRLSLKAEYLWVQFGDVAAHQVASNFISGFTPPSPQNFSQSMKLSANLVRLGLNYRFGDAGPSAAGGGALWDSTVTPFLPAAPSDWQFDAGTRVWFSSGKIGAPQPLLGFAPAPSQLISRLTYTDLNAYSGETFARADHASGIFIKGFVGAGGITRGNLIDEDFPGFGGAYSNTVSPVSGHLGYATIDLGYTFLKAPGAKLGAFVGYNYYTQHLNGFGCNQAAGDTTCVGLDPNFQVFAEDDHFNSVRLGLASEFWLTDQFKFSAEAAYLPWTEFGGQDDHNFRELLFPESAATGNGVMLESILSYALTRNWNIGAGGRYWAWNSHTGNEWFDALGLPPPTQPQLGRFNTERYGFFLQTDYHWGGAATDDAAPEAQRSQAVAAMVPANWTGVYLGGYLGGGWSGDRWSDPFGSTISPTGLVNIAGFGDTVHSSGPLGGGQIGADWQTGPWVVGLDAELGAANLRGENTCFSGLGGLDCQHYVDAVGVAAARFGYAFGQSLVYAKGGAARVSSTYAILGNTNGNTLGFETVDKAATGWMAGAGVQYAFSKNWSTNFEYEHIGVGSVAVPFPAVALINTQNIGVKQSLDLLKLGVNYKFDWAAPFSAGG